MSKLSEITTLFATLASNLQALDPMVRDEEDEDLSITISHLNRSLNLRETHPELRFLDTALSLMCFTASQVFESLIVHNVETIVAVLSSSVQCKILRGSKGEVLQVGGSISIKDCGELIDACVEVLDKLEGQGGDLSLSMLHAVVKVAVMASGSPFTLKPDFNLDEESIDAWKSSISKLLCHLRKELTIRNGEIPLRLQLWHLDYDILKNDISQILQEVKKRTFLCLRVELYERMEWRMIVICLALAPAMFVEARALLHTWFLVTGLASVLELQIELVAMVLDIVSRPMWWGLSIELGSKMPFSLAYFPYRHQLVSTLAGPVTWEGFQHIVQGITGLQSQKKYQRNSEQGPVNIDIVDHKSMWAIAMDFPNWFYFASLLLFSGPSSSLWSNLSCITGSTRTDENSAEEIPSSTAAARFIAWIMNPAIESHQDLLVDYLKNLSESWVLKKLSSDKSSKTLNQYKEVTQLGLNCFENRTFLKYDGPTIWNWLGEFQDMCTRYCRQVEFSAPREAQKSPGYHSQQNRKLFRRITLGTLIGFFDNIDEVGCELLLHYAAIGNLFHLSGSEHARVKHRGNKRGWQDIPTKWTERYTIEQAVAGARIVFDVTDITENMSTSLFETEEKGLSFLCLLKLKIGKYLVECAKRFLLLSADEDNDRLLTLTDLCNSIVRWRHQGQDVFQDYRDLDDIIDTLTCYQMAQES